MSVKAGQAHMVPSSCWPALLVVPSAAFPNPLDVRSSTAPEGQRSYQFIPRPAVNRVVHGHDAVSELVVSEVGEFVTGRGPGMDLDQLVKLGGVGFGDALSRQNCPDLVED